MLELPPARARTRAGPVEEEIQSETQLAEHVTLKKAEPYAR